MVLSVSLVLLLGVLVWFLVRFAGLRGWHALLCVLFGFYLASTPLAPYIPDRLPRPRPVPRRSRVLTRTKPGVPASRRPGLLTNTATTDCPVPQRKETQTHR